MGQNSRDASRSSVKSRLKNRDVAHHKGWSDFLSCCFVLELVVLCVQGTTVVSGELKRKGVWAPLDYPNRHSGFTMAKRGRVVGGGLDRHPRVGCFGETSLPLPTSQSSLPKKVNYTLECNAEKSAFCSSNAIIFFDFLFFVILVKHQAFLQTIDGRSKNSREAAGGEESDEDPSPTRGGQGRNGDSGGTKWRMSQKTSSKRGGRN